MSVLARKPDGISFFLRSRSIRVRSSPAFDFRISARALARPAVCCRTLARASASCASTWLTCACIFAGSRRAITWSLATFELKSTSTSSTWPETCEPTSTVVTAPSVPEAETVARTSPRATFSVLYFTWSASSP